MSILPVYFAHIVPIPFDSFLFFKRYFWQKSVHEEERRISLKLSVFTRGSLRIFPILYFLKEAISILHPTKINNLPLDRNILNQIITQTQALFSSYHVLLYLFLLSSFTSDSFAYVFIFLKNKRKQKWKTGMEKK